MIRSTILQSGGRGTALATYAFETGSALTAQSFEYLKGLVARCGCMRCLLHRHLKPRMSCRYEAAKAAQGTNNGNSSSGSPAAQAGPSAKAGPRVEEPVTGACVRCGTRSKLLDNLISETCVLWFHCSWFVSVQRSPVKPFRLSVTKLRVLARQTSISLVRLMKFRLRIRWPHLLVQIDRS